jgi:hypothetical protein
VAFKDRTFLINVAPYWFLDCESGRIGDGVGCSQPE